MMQSAALVATLFVAVVCWQRLVAARVSGHHPKSALTRRALYLVPLSAVMIVQPTPPAGWLPDWIGALLAATGAAALWVPRVPQLRRDFAFAATGLGADTWFTAVAQGINLLLGVLVQEPIYRALMLWPLSATWSPGVAIVVTSSLFAAEHRLHPAHGYFTSYDYLRQFIFGSLLAAISIATGSLAAPMIGHAVYNAPPFALRLAIARGRSLAPSDVQSETPRSTARGEEVTL